MSEWPQTDEKGKVWTQAEWLKKCQEESEQGRRDKATAIVDYWSNWTNWILPVAFVLFLLWGFMGTHTSDAPWY